MVSCSATPEECSIHYLNLPVEYSVHYYRYLYGILVGSQLPLWAFPWVMVVPCMVNMKPSLKRQYPLFSFPYPGFSSLLSGDSRLPPLADEGKALLADKTQPLACLQMG